MSILWDRRSSFIQFACIGVAPPWLVTVVLRVDPIRQYVFLQWWWDTNGHGCEFNYNLNLYIFFNKMSVQIMDFPIYSPKLKSNQTLIHSCICDLRVMCGTGNKILLKAKVTMYSWFTTAPPTWIPDSEMDKCCSCKLPFTLLRRRHHCRNCGLVSESSDVIYERFHWCLISAFEGF